MENKKPIRVAQIVGKWLGGGVESVLMNYYRNIDRKKIQFDFICDNDSTNIPYFEIKELGGRVYEVAPYQRLNEYINDLMTIFKKNNYLIVHSHINTLSIFPLFAAKRIGIPIRIAHSHSTTDKKEIKRNMIKQILRPFSRIYATHYMACSLEAGEWLFGKKSKEKNKIFIMNNGINFDKFEFDEEIRKSFRKKLNIDDDVLVIGHVGRFMEQKNHRFLLDVFFELVKMRKKALLLLAGQGPLFEEIQDKVIKNGLEMKVIFIGQKENINDYYQAMDVFVLPSLYEGFGLVALEAQASGLPVLLSNNVPKEVCLTQNVEFLSLKKSPKIWAIKILEISQSERCSIAQNNYDIKINAEILVEQYQYYLEKVVNI